MIFLGWYVCGMSIQSITKIKNNSYEKVLFYGSYDCLSILFE